MCTAWTLCVVVLLWWTVLGLGSSLFWLVARPLLAKRSPGAGGVGHRLWGDWLWSPGVKGDSCSSYYPFVQSVPKLVSFPWEVWLRSRVGLRCLEAGIQPDGGTAEACPWLATGLGVVLGLVSPYWFGGQDKGWSLPSGVQSWILGSLTVEPGVPELPSIHQGRFWVQGWGCEVTTGWSQSLEFLPAWPWGFRVGFGLLVCGASVPGISIWSAFGSLLGRSLSKVSGSRVLVVLELVTSQCGHSGIQGPNSGQLCPLVVSLAPVLQCHH